MATYYWVGGAGTWDNSSTTHWATSSGGTGGAGVPTSADNVIFDTLSNATAYAVTIGVTATPANCADITIAGPLTGSVTMTWAATSLLNCYGSWTNAATGVVFSVTAGGQVQLLSTTTGKSIITNSVSSGGMTWIFAGAAGGWTLGTAFTCTGTVSITNGAFNTGNFTVLIGTLSTTGANTRSISLGSSTVTCSAAAPITISNATGLTFNAGTSTIVCSSNTPTFAGGGLTYYNVNFTSATSNSTTVVTGSNTFNNLNQTSPTTSRRLLSIFSNQTVAGTLTLGTANTPTARIQVLSQSAGSVVTLTVATIATLSDVDFRDITAAGASGTWSGTRLGNGLGNTNITFAAGKTVYWNLAAGGNWSATAWATSSGGAVSTTNFPLAQDTAIIDDTGLTTGNTITMEAGWWVGTFNCTRTNAWTFAGAGGFSVYGNFTIPSVTTVTYSVNTNFVGQGLTQTLTTNGVSFAGGIAIASVGGTLVLNGPVTCASTATVTLSNGTLNLSSYTLTTGLFASSNTSVRTIAFGTGKIVLTGLNGTSWTTQTATNLTLTGTSRVELSGAGTSTSFTASCSGTALTTTGSPALGSGNIILSATGVSLGTIASGSGNSWVVSIGGTYASQTMVGAQLRVIDAGFTGGTEANSPNFYVTAGVDAVSITNQRKYGTVDFTGFAGYVNSDNWVFTIYGNLVLNSSIIGFTTTASFQGPIIFGATSGTKTITTAGKTYPVSLTFNGAGGTWQLQDNATVPAANTTTLTAGTLDLNNFVLSTGLFNSSNSNARTLAFGTGSITLTGNATTIWTTNVATNLVVTGTPVVNCTYSGATGTRIILGAATHAETYAISFNIAAATDVVSPQNYLIKDFIVAGGFTGTLTLTSTALYGSLDVGGATSISGTALFFTSTSGTKTITSNGKTIDAPVQFNGVGGTWSLQDPLTLGSTRALSLLAGNLSSNGYDISTGSFVTSGTNTKSLNLSSGNIYLYNTGTVWTATGSGFSMLSNDHIVFQSAVSQTFAGGGFSYGSLFINTSGIKTISGNNTFYNIQNLVTPIYLTFTAGSTNSFYNWNINGTAGNLATLRSTVPGTQYTLVKL